jgi:hypothetical protein
MMYFIHSVLTNMFRPLLRPSSGVILQEYKGNNVDSCVVVTQQQLKIILI